MSKIILVMSLLAWPPVTYQLVTVMLATGNVPLALCAGIAGITVIVDAAHALMRNE